MSVLHHEIRDEFHELHGRVGIERDFLVHGQRDLLRGPALCRGDIQNQFVEFAGASVAGLVEADSLIDQGIIDHDLFAGNFLTVLYDRELGPIFLGRAVGIGFFAGSVAADRERQRSRNAGFHFDLIAGFARGEHEKAAPADESVDDSAEEDQQQAGMHHVHGHLGDAVAF